MLGVWSSAFVPRRAPPAKSSRCLFVGVEFFLCRPRDQRNARLLTAQHEGSFLLLPLATCPCGRIFRAQLVKGSAPLTTAAILPQPSCSCQESKGAKRAAQEPAARARDTTQRRLSSKLRLQRIHAGKLFSSAGAIGFPCWAIRQDSGISRLDISRNLYARSSTAAGPAHCSDVGNRLGAEEALAHFHGGSDGRGQVARGAVDV